MKIKNITPPSMEQLSGASGVAKEAARDWNHYCNACQARFKVVSGILNREFQNDLRGKHVLDWGSAVGGVAIMLDDAMPIHISAADVDHHSMAWLSSISDTIQTVKLEPGDLLPFDNESFDAIYGISVFTHIPPELQDFYLSELRRIVRPSGIVILSVKSYDAVKLAREMNKDPAIHPHTSEQLDKAGIIYTPYPEKVMNKMDFAKDDDYGITYHSRTYIEKHFGKYFEFDIESPLLIGRQNVLVLHPKVE